MAQSKLAEINRRIAEEVVGTYQKIEDGVVGTYKKMEDRVVGTCHRVEDQFVDQFLTREDETVEQAKACLKKGAAEAFVLFFGRKKDASPRNKACRSPAGTGLSRLMKALIMRKKE